MSSRGGVRKIGQRGAAKIWHATAGAGKRAGVHDQTVDAPKIYGAWVSVRLTVVVVRRAIRAGARIRRVRLLRLLLMSALRSAIAAILMLAFIGLHLTRILALRLIGLLSLTVAAVTMALLAVLTAMLLLLLALMLAVRADHAIVVLGMLVEILGRDPVPCGARVARHRQIFLEDLIGVAADTDVGPAAVEGLRALGHMRFTAVITATLTLHVWTGSHDT